MFKLDNSRNQSTRRNLNRIDYRELNSTGRVIRREEEVYVPETHIPETYNSQLSALEEANISLQLDQLSIIEMPSNNEVEANILIQEIEDIIDENPITPDSTVDVNAAVVKLQELRTSLRRYDILLKAENQTQNLVRQIACTLINVKEYIKNSKDCKSKLDLQQIKKNNDEASRKECSKLFVIADLQRILSELITDFSINLGDLTDTELLQLKTDLSSKNELVNKIAQKYELILQTSFNTAEVLLDVQNIGHSYEKLIQIKLCKKVTLITAKS